MSAAPATYFQAELPIPKANIEAYERIYAIEQWLRRIVYAALLGSYGSQWRGALPMDLAAELKKRVAQRHRRSHLSCENSTNLIWFVTVDELRTLFALRSVSNFVRRTMKFPPALLGTKLEELREIRNVVSHSRAASVELVTVLDAIGTSLRPGIEAFKRELLYPHGQIDLAVPDGSGDPVLALFDAETPVENDWRRFQPFFSVSEAFYMATSLPVPPFDIFVRVSEALQYYEPVADVLLALMLNKTGDEFSVVWPKTEITLEQHQRIIEIFMASARSFWTRTEYERQSPRFTCHPQIWFYENRPPIIE